MKGTFSRMAAVALAMGLITPGTAKDIRSNDVTYQKDGVTHKVNKPTAQAERRITRNGSSRVGPEGRFLNQRQYRKRCRQNPSLYKSKKHRSKN